MKTPSILFALTLTALAAHADTAAVLAILDKQCASCHDEERQPGEAAVAGSK